MRKAGFPEAAFVGGTGARGTDAASRLGAYALWRAASTRLFVSGGGAPCNTKKNINRLNIRNFVKNRSITES